MTLRFPLRGINKGFATTIENAETTFDALNVRAVDTLDNRLRGGQRPPLRLWANGTQVGDSDQPVVEMCVVQAMR
jgi:hypothetical protein